MSYVCRFHALTKQDINEAYIWYENGKLGLGERFLRAIRKKIEEITLHPEPAEAEAIKSSEKRN